MVGEQKTLARRYTVGALLLQAVVLLGYAAVFFLDSLATSYELAAGFGNMAAAVIGGLGAIAIWLAGEHYSETVSSRRLQLWAISFFVLSLIPLTSFAALLILYHSIISLVNLLSTLLLTIASLMVLIFARKETTTGDDISNLSE